MKKVMYNNSELSGSFGQESTPIGTILMYGGTRLPFGFLWCNGSAVSRTVYADLFNAIGTAFGSGDGSTTFNLPDYRESVPMGASDDYPLGSTGGEKEHTLTALELPSHEHGIYSGNQRVHYFGNFNVTSGSSGGYWAGSQGSQPTVAKGGVGDQPHNNLQPYQTCNFIIKFCKAITPAQEQFIDDSVVSAEKTWSSEKITQKLTEWVDITDQVTLTQVSSQGSWSYSVKKFYMCGNQVKCSLRVIFNYGGSAGGNPLKLRISSPLFTTNYNLSSVYYSSYYGSNIWTNGLNVYGGEDDVITFRPNHNFVSGEDSAFMGIIAVIPR